MCVLRSFSFRLAPRVERLAQDFRGDQAGSISVLGAVFISLLLGMGTVAMKVGDTYAEKLRDFRTVDIAVNAAAKAAGNSVVQANLIDKIGGMNGTHFGLVRIIEKGGHTHFIFSCGIEVVI